MAVGEEVIVIGNPCTLTDNELSVLADANACAVGGYLHVIINDNAAENTACCMRNFLSCKLKVIGKSVIKTGNIGLGTLLNTLMSAAVGLVAGLFPIIKNIERKVSACAGKSRGLTVGIGYCSLAFGKVFVAHNVDCRLCVRLSGLGEIVGGNQSILYVDGTVIIYTAALNFNGGVCGIRGLNDLAAAGIVNDLREALHHFDIGGGRIGVGALYVADSAGADIYARAVRVRYTGFGGSTGTALSVSSIFGYLTAGHIEDRAGNSYGSTVYSLFLRALKVDTAAFGISVINSVVLPVLEERASGILGNLAAEHIEHAAGLNVNAAALSIGINVGSKDSSFRLHKCLVSAYFTALKSKYAAVFNIDTAAAGFLNVFNPC